MKWYFDADFANACQQTLQIGQTPRILDYVRVIYKSTKYSFVPNKQEGSNNQTSSNKRAGY